MKYLSCILLIIILLLVPVYPQERVSEEVSVDWWVLPIFAVDRSGNPVLDLEAEDIALQVNNYEVTDFSFYRRVFTVDQEVQLKKLPETAVRKRMVFLLFDNVFTTQSNYEWSKSIAKDLVQKADQDTLFSVMIIDAFKGPIYAGGPTADKAQVLKLIDEKVVWDADGKDWRSIVNLVQQHVQVAGGRFAKYGGGELRIYEGNISGRIRANDQRYFLSFQTLYHLLQSIKDNKFIYLFSEGLSLYVRKAIKYGEEEYYQRLKQTADILGRSGSVLFIINPKGSDTNMRNAASGEDTLRYLARESGGKYMEGNKESVSSRIERMNRAYYEIAFPDHSGFKGDLRRVTLRSKKRGVRLHTLRSVEKTKNYTEMKEIQKEVLAINLLADNPLFQYPVKSLPMDVEKMKEKGQDIHYKIKLPAEFQGQVLDLYTVRFAEEQGQADIDKKVVNPRERVLEFTAKRKGAASVRLVLISEKLETALVQGKVDLKAIKKAVVKGSAQAFQKKMDQMSQEERKTLDDLLVGAGTYCIKLEGSIMRYFCKETVAEVVETLGVYDTKSLSAYEFRTGMSAEAMADGKSGAKVQKHKITNKYVNDYQLILKGGRLQEQRKLIKGQVKKFAGHQDALKLDNFVSRKISLAPLALMSPESQQKFAYRFVKYDKLKGVKTAVIECFPKDADDVKSNFGKIWIDLENHSIMRLDLNPVSIGGYPRLLQLARQLDSKLILTCRLDFYNSHGGLRFPTQVIISEKYSGGTALRRFVGRNVWERSKTIYTYDDYRYFEVSVQSETEDIK